jgi:hypothetical protein
MKLEYTTRDFACNRCPMLLTLKSLCAIFALVAIVYFFVTDARRPPPDKSVKLSNDEFSTLVGVASYALKKLGRPIPFGGLPTDLPSMDRYLRSDTFNPISGLLPRYISRAELAFLAPYIDDWIVGQAPPQNLPAEYPDERPDQLRALKQRMQQQGFWPNSTVSS